MIRALSALAAMLLATLGVLPAYSSEPTGMFVLVQEVRRLPASGRDGERLAVRGVFQLEVWDVADNRDNDMYGPFRGWITFTLPHHKHELAKAEWKELEELAARTKKRVVAFGSAYAEPIDIKGPVYEFGTKVSSEPWQSSGIPFYVDHGMYLIREDSKMHEKLAGFGTRP